VTTDHHEDTKDTKTTKRFSLEKRVLVFFVLFESS